MRGDELGALLVAGRCMSRAMVSDGGAVLGEIKVGFYTRYIRDCKKKKRASEPLPRWGMTGIGKVWLREVPAYLLGMRRRGSQASGYIE